MFYEEKYENGLYYSRHTPNGTWMPIGAIEMSLRYNQNTEKILGLKEEIEELVNILKSWRPFVENAETVNEKDSDYVDSLLCKGNNFINKYNKTT